MIRRQMSGTKGDISGGPLLDLRLVFMSLCIFEVDYFFSLLSRPIPNRKDVTFFASC